MKVLLTRAIEDNIILAKSINEIGLEPISYPLINYHPLNQEIDNFTKYDNVIITSKFAILAFKKLEDKNIYIVGKSNAELALNLGFKNIEYVARDVEDLIKYLKSYENDYGNFIYLSGNHITKALDARIKREIVYEIRYTTTLSPEILDLLNMRKIENFLFFSSNTAIVFLKLINKYNLLPELKGLNYIVKSRKIAKVLLELSDSIYIAQDKNKMINQLKNL